MLKTIYFEYENKFYEADVIVDGHLEKGWGQDIDGNRGSPRFVRDSIEILAIRDEIGNKVEVNSVAREIVEINV